MDKVAIDAIRIRNQILKIKGIQDCHEIRSRGRLDDIRVDLHILVNSDMTVHESHHIANLVEKDIKVNFVGVTEVLVHIEPLDHDHEDVEGITKK